jgi:hypothetical protein
VVIGSVLLQPQKLARAVQLSNDDAILSDIISLGMRLAIDRTRGGQLGSILSASMQGTVERFAAQAGAGVNSAVIHFGALFQPLVSAFETTTATAPDDTGTMIDGLETGLTSIINTLKNLNADQLRGLMNRVFDILEDDLGITPTFVRAVVLGFFDDMILALQTAPTNEPKSARENRRAVAALLSRIRRYLNENFSFPALNADAAAGALLDLRQQPEVDAVLDRALCSAEAALTYLRAGESLVEALPYSAFAPFGDGSIGAAASPTAREEVSFYASKLLENDNYDGDLGEIPIPADELIVDETVTPSMREAFKHASIVLASSAYLYTVDENKKWRVIDRKRYVIHKVGSSLWVYHPFEVGIHDFMSANQGDLSDLRKLFRENGYMRSGDLTTVHATGSNTWEIVIGGSTFVGTVFMGKITIRPANRTSVLYELPVALEPSPGQKVPTTELREAFAGLGVPLSPRASLSMRESNQEWLLDDGDFEYTLEKESGKFKVTTGGFWNWIRANLTPLKGDAVWVNKERTQVLLGQRILHVGTEVSWDDAPIFNRLNGNRYYSFRNHPETIEGWAFHTSWIQDVADSLIYSIKIGKAAVDGKVEYSITSNGLKIGRYVSEITVKLAQHRPMRELVGIGFWYDLLLDAGIGIIGGIESAVKPSEPTPPTTANEFSQFVDKVLGLIASVEPIDTHWNDLISEFILSLLTLINHVEPTDPARERPENYTESGGFVDLFWNVSLLIYTAAIPRSEYALPFQTASLTGGYWLGGALGVGLVMGFVGLLVGQGAVAKVNVFADGKHFAKTLLKSSGKSLLYFWPYLKLVNGRTE